VGRGSFGTDDEAGSVAVSDLGVSQNTLAILGLILAP
jgi:hypothetical protein